MSNKLFSFYFDLYNQNLFLKKIKYTHAQKNNKVKKKDIILLYKITIYFLL